MQILFELLVYVISWYFSEAIDKNNEEFAQYLHGQHLPVFESGTTFSGCSCDLKLQSYYPL